MILKKPILNPNICEKAYGRAIHIIKCDNLLPSNARDEKDTYSLCDSILQANHRNIYKLKASLSDIIRFADEYGCSVDYLLGRTENPYPFGM